MNNRDQSKRTVMFFLSAAVVLIQTSVYAYIWFRFYNNEDTMIQPFYNNGNYVIIGLYALMTILFYTIFGCFRVGYLRIYDMLFNQVAALLCVHFVTYLQLCLICRMAFLDHLGPILIMTLIDLVVVLAWALASRWLFVKIFPPRELLLVYGKYSPDNLVHKLSSRQDKYVIRETISIDNDIELIKQKITENEGVVLTDIPSEIRNVLLKFCFAKDIRCYSVPKISDIMIMNSSTINLFDTSLLLFRNNGLTFHQRFLKRAFDIIVSLAGIIVVSPIMLVIAVCIKAYDGGPVFFTQERLTQGGRVFKIYKFRSMHVQKEEGEYCMTRKGDSRVTPVGKVLRNIHFDELPQLFNILKGDMSIVGPRPECPKLAEEYAQIIPEFPFRLKMKAGLTGYAQVYGKYNTTPYDKLKMDLTYIKKYSFGLDLRLIFMTFKILFQKENTEGIESWQKTAATKDNLQQIGK